MEVGKRYLVREGAYSEKYCVLCEFLLLEEAKAAYKIHDLINDVIRWIDKSQFVEDEFPPKPNLYYIVELLKDQTNVELKSVTGYGDIIWDSGALWKFACAVKADKRNPVPWETFLDEFISENKKNLEDFNNYIREKNEKANR